MDKTIKLVTAAFLVLFGSSTLAGSGNAGDMSGGGPAGVPGSERTGGTSGRAGPSVTDILGDQDKDQQQDQDRLHQDPDQLQDRDQDRDQLKDQDQDPDKDQIRDQDRLHQDSQ